MLKFTNVSMRNFLSVGNVTQSIDLDISGLTLVLGSNLDNPGVRNGTGKTTILNAVSFALFGRALSDIKKDNLVNNINNKNMIVTIDFETGNKKYRIERGRKPAFLKYYVNEDIVNSPDSADESQGESKWTQVEIEKVVGFTHAIFPHIIGLNTYTDPFLKMKVADQRTVIEELFGITAISTKADTLKEMIKVTKDSVKEEEFRIKAQLESNSRIEKLITEQLRKSEAWNKTHNATMEKLSIDISKLENLDIDTEISNHRLIVDIKEIQKLLSQVTKDFRRVEIDISSKIAGIEKAEKQLTTTLENKCHTCGQEIHGDHGQSVTSELENKIQKLVDELEKLNIEFTRLEKEKFEYTSAFNELMSGKDDLPKIEYSNIEEALDHKNKMDRLIEILEKEMKENNPYEDQAVFLASSGVQEITYENVNELQNLLNHQEYLLKLLTSKESFIRKKIIDQNLNFLNHRLNNYLDKLGLPHEVKFMNDLSTEISHLSKDLDFGQLSRGEGNRISLATSFSFRDIFENLNHPMNLWIIDEIADTGGGLDTSGSEACLSLLKDFSRNKSKNILMLSNKDDLASRVSTILIAKKEKNFTNFEYEELGDS